MNSRLLAADILEQCLEGEGQSHLLLRGCFASHPDLSGRDRGLITALVHGTLSRALTLDFYLAQVSRTDPADLKPYMRTVLRMSLYQMKYMDRIPASAICNEAVKLIRRRLGEGLTSFANGVLRAAARKTDWREPEGAAALSLPKELYEKWLFLYGEERVRRMGESFLEPPALWGRRMMSRCTEEELLACLEGEGYYARPHELFPQAIRLEKNKLAEKEAPPPDRLSAYQKGWLLWQDISAQLAVAAAAPKPGMRILDLCAAPGGKSLQAADLTENKGEIIACDISEEKCALIREGAARTGADSVQVLLSDALKPRPEWEGAFDLVIADLPCSGLGVAGRKPEIKYRVTERDIRELAALQKRMLRQAVSYIKPGGRLLFSTCTLSREENDENADYLAAEAGLVPEDIKLALPEGLLPQEKGRLTLLPGDIDGDGFFISLFSRPE